MTTDRSTRPPGPWRYVGALLALLALTALSYGLAALHPAGETAIALAIATVKVLIVAFVFMHLGEARATAQLAALIAILTIGLLCAGVTLDVGLR